LARTGVERSLADSSALSPISTTEPATPRKIPAVAIGGAIDIGSNSVHLLVSLFGPGWMETLRDTSDLLGLGDIVDREGAIPRAARARVIDVLRQYVETAHRSHAEQLTIVGTEPLRRARNADVLIDEIAEATGLHLVILSEHDEALLTFLGVTRGNAPDTRLIVVDIGGGSTEISTWTPDAPLRIDTLPLGSSRLANAVVEHDPPSEEEIDGLFRLAAEAVGEVTATPAATADLRTPMRAIFVGGTATNVARLGQLTRKRLAEDRATLAKLKFAAISARYNVKPRRARQLAAGVAIVDAILERYGLAAAEVSEASLRDGVIMVAARYGPDWIGSLEASLPGMLGG
jgi:exopolyphosphatase/guanosine-5'-triphosphate,3'-diphosphate pyrophosphatase